MKRALAMLSLALFSCTPCQAQCEKLRDQLVRDFGVMPTSINCSDPAWFAATTCEKCRAMLERDYGVALVQCDSPFVEPRTVDAGL